MTGKTMKGTAIMLGLLFVALAQSGYASAVLMLSSGADSVTIYDNDSSACIATGAALCTGDLSPLAGSTTYVGAIGAFIVNVTTGTTHPILPALPGGDIIDLNTVSTSNAAGALTITWEDTGFTPGADSLKMLIGGTQAGKSTVNYKAWFDGADVLGAETLLLGNLTFSNPGSLSAGFNGDATSAVTNVAPFSLKQRVVIAHDASGGGITSFDASITPLSQVPEPSSLLLLGSGLLGFGSIARKKFFRG